MRVSNASAGTCGHHPSWMEVLASEKTSLAGIIHGASVLCPIGNPADSINPLLKTFLSGNLGC